jgi:hypothetical protein
MPHIWPFTRSGAIAGAGSAVAFAFIHQVLITDIWFSLAMMVVAGALCGLCVGWCFGLLHDRPTSGNWVRFNLLFVLMFGLLAAVSILIFEPVTTLAAVIQGNGPPGDLIGQAMPITILFTLAAAGLLALRYAQDWSQVAAILLTCSILVLALGLNVSVIGLVAIPRSSLYLVVEQFALIVAINLSYLMIFMALERARLVRKRTNWP